MKEWNSPFASCVFSSVSESVGAQPFLNNQLQVMVAWQQLKELLKRFSRLKSNPEQGMTRLSCS